MPCFQRISLVILANELLGADLTPADVSCKGISSLTQQDIETAAKDNCRWKLIGSASRDHSGRIEASVPAQRLPLDHPFASVCGATNAISFKTEMLGAVTVNDPRADRIETAYAFLSDIVAIHRNSDGFAGKETVE